MGRNKGKQTRGNIRKAKGGRGRGQGTEGERQVGELARDTKRESGNSWEKDREGNRGEKTE
jgi:hypothetical protein